MPLIQDPILVESGSSSRAEGIMSCASAEHCRSKVLGAGFALDRTLDEGSIVELSTVSSASLPIGMFHRDYFRCKCLRALNNSDDERTGGKPCKGSKRPSRRAGVLRKQLDEYEKERTQILVSFNQLLAAVEERRAEVLPESQTTWVDELDTAQLDNAIEQAVKLKLAENDVNLSFSNLEQAICDLELALSFLIDGRCAPYTEADTLSRNEAFNNALKGKPMPLMRKLRDCRGSTSDRMRSIVQSLSATRIISAWRGFSSRSQSLAKCSGVYANRLTSNTLEKMPKRQLKLTFVRFRNCHIRTLRAEHDAFGILGVFGADQKRIKEQINHLQNDLSVREDAAQILQASLRGFMVRRKLVPGIYALRIQKVWRGYQSRRVDIVPLVAADVTKKTVAAMQQRWVIGRVRLKSDVLLRARAIARAQACARSMSAFNLGRGEAKAKVKELQTVDIEKFRKSSIVVLQSHWRGYFSRFYNRAAHERAVATTCISAFCRGQRDRHLLVTQRIGESYAQKISQTFRARWAVGRVDLKIKILMHARALRRARASLALTSVFNPLKIRENEIKLARLQKDERILEASAAVLQSRWRGYTMRVFKATTYQRSLAVTHIAAFCRGQRERFAIVAPRVGGRYAKITTKGLINRFVVGRVQQKVDILLHAHAVARINAEVKVQNQFLNSLRGNFANGFQSTLDQERICKASAVVLQSHWRGYVARTLCHSPHERARSVTRIAAMHKGWKDRCDIVARYIAEKYSRDVAGRCVAVTLSSKVRMKRDLRLRMWSEAKTKCASSKSILPAFLQGGQRSPLSAMSWLSSVPEHYQTAATILQAWYRGCLVRKMYSQVPQTPPSTLQPALGDFQSRFDLVNAAEKDSCAKAGLSDKSFFGYFMGIGQVKEASNLLDILSQKAISSSSTSCSEGKGPACTPRSDGDISTAPPDDVPDNDI